MEGARSRKRGLAGALRVLFLATTILALSGASIQAAASPGGEQRSAKGHGHWSNRIYGFLQKGRGAYFGWFSPGTKKFHPIKGVVPNGNAATLSHEGKSLYCYCRTGSTVGVMRPDGSHLRILGHPQIRVLDEGRTLSGTGTIAISAFNGESSGSHQIVVMKQNSFARQTIYTAFSKPPTDSNSFSTELGPPVISANGQYIAFTEGESEQGICPSPSSCPESATIKVMNSDGSDLRTVYTAPTCSNPANLGVAPEDFARDSHELVISGPVGACSGSIDVGVAVVDAGIGATGSSPPFLPLPLYWSGGIQMSPMGNKIAFTGKANGKYAVYSVGTDGSALHRLTPLGEKPPEVDDWGLARIGR